MNRVKFLGTAGGRFAAINQIRKSGGIWLTRDKTDILIDPGPGSLVNCLSSRPKLNPKKLDGIILTHSHIDHSNDINIMIEAMTNGGFDNKGKVFLPKEALERDNVIMKHFRDHVSEINYLEEMKEYEIGNISFSTPKRNIHGVESYGINFFGKDISISIISDTKFYEEIIDFFTGDIIILNVVLLESIDEIKRLSVKDAEYIIKKVKPKLAILTHFGMKIIKANPWEIAEKMSKKLGQNIIAARDGMNLNLTEYEK